jgi:hypothetical protein
VEINPLNLTIELSKNPYELLALAWQFAFAVEQQRKILGFVFNRVADYSECL